MEYFRSGEGPLLIYLPGMEGSGKLFFHQEPQLSRRFTVACLPCRSTPSFTYNDLIQDVLEIYRRENVDTAVVVGESFGGTIALQFAMEHPDRVNHLFLANTFSYFRNRVDLALSLFLLPLGFWKPGRWVRNFFMIRMLTSENVDREAISKLLECSFAHGYQASRQRLKLIREHDVRNRLKTLRMPVTILAGEKDQLLPSVREGKFLAKEIPNARLIVLGDSGHACFLSRRFSLAEVLNENAILSAKS
jgi:pimeloyl-ACP methyl ester carboxylesterase